MGGGTTRTDERRKSSQGGCFAGFPRSEGQAFSHNPKVAGSDPAPAAKRILGPTFPEGFLPFGVEVCNLRHAGVKRESAASLNQ